MHTVDVVAANDVGDHVDGALPDIGIAWIHPHETSIVVGAQRCRRIPAKRIEPGVQLEAARVRLLNCECERIVVRRFVAEEDGPGFDRGGVERIGHRPDLKKNRIEMDRRRAFEDGDELLLLLI